jgi:hypothetical protein
VQPDAVLAARDLGGVGAAANDRSYDGGISVRAWCRRKRDLVADVQTCVGRQSFVDRNRPRALRV